MLGSPGGQEMSRVKPGLKPLTLEHDFSGTYFGTKPNTASTHYHSTKAMNNAILKTLGVTSPEGEHGMIYSKLHFDDSSTNLDEFSNLKSDIFKLMGGTESMRIKRNIQSAVNLKTASSRPISQE